MTALREHLEARREGGRKLLVPYIMGGIPDAHSFPSALAAIATHADAVEIGLPYSDPLMDGPVIAAAGERALRAGLRPLGVVDLVARNEVGPPRAVMTYYNPIHRIGEHEFCRRAAAAGLSGLIVPDIPIEESASLQRAAAEHELAWIPLVAPTSSPERVSAIVAGAAGFVYAVSTLGVTGTREELSERAAAVVAACRVASDLPVLVGIGVSTVAHAAAAAEQADGVVIGSAVVRAVLNEGADAARAFLSGVRHELDRVGRAGRSTHIC
ncbi:MAG: tryptophan synthase subunit alpha [Actinomycetota bacterium]